MASIKRRGESYLITVSKGYDVYGRKLFETATFKPDPRRTEKQQQHDLQEFVWKFEDKVKNGVLQDGRKITLQEFSNQWLEEYAKQNLQPRTLEKYESELNSRILPALGHYKLNELKPGIITAFLAGLTKDGTRQDKKLGGLARSSIGKIKMTLSSILSTAEDWELIERNPCDKVKLPSGQELSEQMKFFTPEQVKTFLHYIEQPYKVHVPAHGRTDDTGKSYKVRNYKRELTVPEQQRILFNLAIYSGLRKGELIALKFSDIDFEKDTVTVSRSATIVKGKQICKVPKTKTSNRVVTIPHDLTLRIQQLQQNREEYRKALYDMWQGDDWIFIQDNGQMMNYGTPLENFHAILRRYNVEHPDEPLPVIPFHGLRHTSATLLLSAHQDVVTVAKRLGHAQASTTMDIYAHALKESDKKAADALANLLQ